MLSRRVVTLACIRPGSLQGAVNEALHGAFFHLVRDWDSMAATDLHGAANKPFTMGATGNVRIHGMAEGQEWAFDVSGLTDAANLAIDRAFAKGAIVPLGRSAHRIVNVAMKESATFEELVETGFADSWMKMSLEALSPTSFRRLGRQILLPDPGLVFGTLQRRWSEFSTVTPDTSLMERWPEDVLVTQFNVRTAVETFDRYKIIGFVGRVDYGIRTEAPQYMRGWFRALAQFARFAGLGYKTTMGMGRVRVTPAR